VRTDNTRTGFGRKTAVLLATGFGLGYSPVASGTAGSVLGVVLALGIACLPGLVLRIGVVLVLVAVAIPVCDAAEEYFGTKDDGRIVADEYLTFPICVLGLPLSPWLLAVAFVVNRGLDVVKPPPARRLQACHGGFGIVVDDFIACLYGLAVNHAIYHVVTRLWA